MGVLRASKLHHVQRHKLAGDSPESTGKSFWVKKLKYIELCKWMKSLAKIGFPINKGGLMAPVR